MAATSACVVEPLEHRLLLASFPEPHISRSGTLLVKGTPGADVIGIDRKGDTIRVIEEDPTGTVLLRLTTFPAANVKRLFVEGLSGKDRIGVRSSFTRPCTILGGSGNDVLGAPQGATLLGGNGNDVLSCAVPNVGSLAASELIAPNEEGETGTPKKRGVLNGGEGDDILITWRFDSITGAGGNDFCYVNQAGQAVIDFPTIESTFGGRALGVEQFALLPIPG